MQTKIAVKLLLPALLFLALFSCEKEQLQPTEQAPETTVNFRNSSSLDDLQFDGEMFSFDSWEAVEQAENALSALVDEHNALFDEQHGDLDDEAYNDLIDELGFDEFQPLADFEAQYGISSKRVQMNTLVNEWLAEATDIPELETFPDNFPLQSPALRALINEQGQIRVADEIHSIDETESHSGPACVRSARDINRFMYNHNIFMLLDIGQVKSIFPFQRASSRVISLRRRGYTQPWRFWRVRNLTANISGTFRKRDCSTLAANTAFSRTTTSPRRRSSVTTRFTRFSFNNRRFISGSCDIEATGSLGALSVNVCP